MNNNETQQHNTVNEIIASYKTKSHKVVAQEAINNFLEIEKRRGLGVKVASSKDIHELLTPYFAGLELERFYLVCLSTSNKVLSVTLINEGDLTGCLVDFKKIFRTAILETKCKTCIVAHNHPSGNNRPSDNDMKLTRRLKEGLTSLDLKLLDSYIYAGLNNYYSFVDEGML